MITIKVLDLEREDKKLFFYRKNKINKAKKELQKLIDQNHEFDTRTFAISKMFPEEINFNNRIESYKSDYHSLNELFDKAASKTIDRKRSINLYRGYKFILTRRKITKESLKRLYKILSDDLIEDTSTMGEYYRIDKEYVTKGHGLFVEYEEKVKPENVERLMNSLLRYINKPNDENDDIEIFIKSQVIHLFFVYVHPYIDVNGRTSRTLAMWYLLNNDCYNFMMLNKAIEKNRTEYAKTISKAIKTGNITDFILFTINGIKREIESELLIKKIEEELQIKLTSEEKEVIEYFYESRVISIDRIIEKYNQRNAYMSKNNIINKIILPLEEKGIIKIDDSLTDDGKIIIELNMELLKKIKQKIKSKE